MSDMKKPGPRILYLGPLGTGSTTRQRLAAFNSLGYHCIAFDSRPYHEYGSRLHRSFAHHLAYGKPVRSLNQDLLAFAAAQDYQIIWIDKGVWIYPETLARLKANGAIAIHYTPDPAITFHQTRHFLKSIPLYDAMVTTKTYEVELYRAHGSKQTIFSEQGYDPETFYPRQVDADTQARLGSDVCFIGRCEPHYLSIMQAIAAKHDNVAIWGRWGPQAAQHPWLAPVYRGEGLWGADYANALCSAKIAIGLLSALVGDQTTTRTYEITACGTFMLAQRTPEHMALFEEGKEAEFFSSKEEMLEKIAYYLAHPVARERIAAAGRARCVSGGYDNGQRLAKIMAQINLAPAYSNERTANFHG